MGNRGLAAFCAITDFLSSDKMGHRPCPEPVIARAWRRIRAARWLFRGGMAAGMLSLLWPVGPDWSQVPPIVTTAVLAVVLVVWAKLDLKEREIARAAREAESASGAQIPPDGSC